MSYHNTDLGEVVRGVGYNVGVSLSTAGNSEKLCVNASNSLE